MPSQPSSIPSSVRLSDLSVSTLVAGFVAMLTGYKDKAVPTACDQ